MNYEEKKDHGEVKDLEMAEQQLRNIRVVSERRPIQRGRTLLVRRIDVGFVVKQQLRNGTLAFQHR